MNGEIERSLNGRVTYSIDENSAEYFSIDPNDGVIELVKMLDYELRKEWKVHYFVVKCVFYTKKLLIYVIILIFFFLSTIVFLQINVTASDGGQPEPLTSSVTVTVTLKDINDNKPVFVSPSEDNITVYASIETPNDVIYRIKVRSF